jgi:hypothetical protein
MSQANLVFLEKVIFDICLVYLLGGFVPDVEYKRQGGDIVWRKAFNAVELRA